jgi:hypothetical protein
LNLKLAKRLRKMAHQMSLQPDGRVLPVRQLMVHPAHEARAKEEGLGHVTAVNNRQTWRGIYRWLKRNYHYA